MIETQPPEHMSRWARNERLYRHLLAMGLVVEPVFADSAQTRIDHLRVTSELPFFDGVSEQPAQSGICSTVQRTEIGNVIRSAESLRDGIVIELPTIR